MHWETHRGHPQAEITTCNDSLTQHSINIASRNNEKESTFGAMISDRCKSGVVIFLMESDKLITLDKLIPVNVLYMNFFVFLGRTRRLDCMNIRGKMKRLLSVKNPERRKNFDRRVFPASTSFSLD